MRDAERMQSGFGGPVGAGLALAIGALLLSAAGAASAERAGAVVYSWETEDGTAAYADDWKRVPKRYRASAEKRASTALAGYGRYTPQPAAPAAEREARMAARLAHLVELNAAHEEAALEAARSEPRTRVLLQTGSSAVPAIEVEGVDDAPVVVETLRYKPEGRIVTRHNTIVRQGDKILTIVKQRQRGETNVSRDILDESDLP
jgi:hypothetical protein